MNNYAIYTNINSKPDSSSSINNLRTYGDRNFGKSHKCKGFWGVRTDIMLIRNSVYSILCGSGEVNH